MLLVRERTSEGYYAIKRISKRRALHQHQNLQVERELSVHGHLRHPNVIRMYAWFHDVDSIHMVTEFAEVTVSGLLQAKYVNGIPEPLCRRLGKQLGCGLSYLHSLHIIHRDLKPSNLFLVRSSDGFALKIGDFGCCVHTVVSDLRQSVCGSVPYMSPEMVGTGRHSFPVDIWSLGVSLHEMLTNSLPFDGAEPMAIYRQIVREVYAPFVGATEAASELLKACLRKDPLQRPTAADLLKSFDFFN